MSRRGMQGGMHGFTLLEVMVTLAILGMSLTAISRSQQNSVRAANRAKLITVATMLARYKMVDVEDKLFEDGFSDFEETDKGNFKEEGFDRFAYELKVDKIELPANVNADSLTTAMGGGDDTSDTSASDPAAKQSSMMSMGAQMMAKQFEMIRNVLEQSIRRVQLKVSWKEGSQTRAVTVVGYFTDPRKIDAASGGGGLPTTGTTGAAGATGTTGATTTGSTPSTGTTPSTGGTR